MDAANELSVLGDFYQVDALKNYAQQVLGKYLGEYKFWHTSKESAAMAVDPEWAERGLLRW
jgi:hypothetical protein